jgi:hypothetical protein
MRAFIRQRPWVIIVAVKVIFVTWWIAFIIYASQHTPEDVPAKPASHGSH